MPGIKKMLGAGKSASYGAYLGNNKVSIAGKTMSVKSAISESLNVGDRVILTEFEGSNYIIGRQQTDSINYKTVYVDG